MHVDERIQVHVHVHNSSICMRTSYLGLRCEHTHIHAWMQNHTNAQNRHINIHTTLNLRWFTRRMNNSRRHNWMNSIRALPLQTLWTRSTHARKHAHMHTQMHAYMRIRVHYRTSSWKKKLRPATAMRAPTPTKGLPMPKRKFFNSRNRCDRFAVVAGSRPSSLSSLITLVSPQSANTP